MRGSFRTCVAAAVDAALVAVHDWTFPLGPNITLGLNTALLARLNRVAARACAAGLCSAGRPPPG